MPKRSRPDETQRSGKLAEQLSQAGSPLDAVAWRCGTRTIVIRVDPATDAVRLSVDGRTLTLLSAQAASGARFADAQGKQFREHAGEATPSLAGGGAVVRA